MVLCGGALLNERAVPFVLLSVEREKGEVEDTVAAPVNRTDGRTDEQTDGRTHAHGRLFSDLTNFKDVYAKPARGDGKRRGRGRGRGIEV